MRNRIDSNYKKFDFGKINLPVILRNRVYGIFAIVSLVFLLIIAIPVKSTYSIQSCQNIETSIKIIDESGGKRLSGTSLATLENSPFKTYVTTVSKHISTKVKEMAQCQEGLKSQPKIELFFVFRPLVTSVQSSGTPFDLKREKSNPSRSLDSPWVKLTKSRSSQLGVTAVFVWNERQFLIDQSLMSSAKASPAQQLISIDDRIFGKFVQDYTNSVLLASSPENKAAAQIAISKRLPNDILWLFRNAWQSTLAPFSTEVDYAFRTTIQRGASGYTDITNTLVDQFLGSTKTEVRYKSVLDLKDVFNISKYRINKLYKGKN
jgi:hypothetical protein